MSDASEGEIRQKLREWTEKEHARLVAEIEVAVDRGGRFLVVRPSDFRSKFLEVLALAGNTTKLVETIQYFTDGVFAEHPQALVTLRRRKDLSEQ